MTGPFSSGLRASHRAGTFAGHSRDYSAVIAAIPIFALVALCLLAIAVSLMGAAFRTAKAIGSPRAIAAAKRMPRAPQNPIHLLRWATLPIRPRIECARGRRTSLLVAAASIYLLVIGPIWSCSPCAEGEAAMSCSLGVCIGQQTFKGRQLPDSEMCLCCRFENVTCAVPGSRFNDSHWGNRAMTSGRQASHGRPLASSGLGPDARKADMVRTVLSAQRNAYICIYFIALAETGQMLCCK